MKKQIKYISTSFLVFVIALLGACTQKHQAPITTLGTLSSDYYIVKRNDSLQAIAINYGIPPSTIIQINRLRSPYQLYIGQKLQLKANNSQNPYRQAQTSTLATATQQASPGRTKYSAHNRPNKTKRKRTTLVKKTTKAIKHTTTKRKRSFANKKRLAATPKSTPARSTLSSWSWPTKGKVIKPYMLKGKFTNKGIDIGGIYGQPIYAVKPGKVIYSGPGVLGYGNMLIIEHPKQLLTVYANNKSLLVKEGQIIKKGQTIATMGRLASQQPGLHFELRRNGRPLNPLKYLKA